MINLLRINLKGGVKGVLAALFTVCLIFGYSVRTGPEPSFSQHCLAIITDHYYLLYFMLPLFLLLIFFVIEDDSEAVILRYQTYFRYFTHKWLSLAAIAFFFMAVQLIAIGISGIGLPVGGGWSIAAGSTTQELFTTLSASFPSPVFCLFAASAYMLAGLCIAALITMWIGHFVSKSGAVKIIVFLYLLSVMSIKVGFVRDWPITTFNYFVILHHNLTSLHRLTITAVTSAILIGIILWTAKKHWNQRLFIAKRTAKGITPYYCKELLSRKNVITLVAVVLVMVIWKYLQRAGDINGSEWIMSLYAGHGTGGFHILSFIEMLLLNGTPVYLLGVFIEKVTTEHSAFITIRLKKRRDILAGILTSGLLFIFMYGVFLAVFPIVGFAVLGTPPVGGTLALLGTAVIMKLLDIMVQALCILVIYCLTGQITVGFVGLVAANLLCIAATGLARYLPFGLSSLSRINIPKLGAEGVGSLYVLGILLATCVLLVGWLFTVGVKRLPKN